MKSPIAISLAVFCFVLLGTATGVWLRRLLPEHHLTKESESVVKLGVGLIATMAALVLSLLISSAKSTYDTKTNEVSQITADIVMVDQLLAEYGPDSKPTREQLRTSVQAMVQTLWPNQGEELLSSRTFVPAKAALETWRLVNALPAQTDVQRALGSEIVETTKHLSQLRLLLFAQSGSSIPTPFLVILVFWLAVIFASFSLFGPTNATVVAFTFLFALSAAGAVFLIYELSDPFAGMLQVSKAPMLHALGPISP